MTIPDPPWKQARANQKSARQEKKLAAEKGGRQQVNSGRLWWSKRDVRLNGFLVEARTTESASYTISKVEFAKLTRDAFGTPPGQLPAMQLDFDGPEPMRLFVMRLEDHQYFMERIAMLEAELDARRK